MNVIEPENNFLKSNETSPLASEICAHVEHILPKVGEQANGHHEDINEESKVLSSEAENKYSSSKKRKTNKVKGSSIKKVKAVLNPVPLFL
ncbi:hypothetical protein KSP40_PGU015283 [Platanthera guangdongensis]|uniref:Uncharacterized protein n=1 Tax=Platanthera guangdongensis TaxID=2320717 RepID=A0ABR2LU91_9ASPA